MRFTASFSTQKLQRKASTMDEFTGPKSLSSVRVFCRLFKQYGSGVRRGCWHIFGGPQSRSGFVILSRWYHGCGREFIIQVRRYHECGLGLSTWCTGITIATWRLISRCAGITDAVMICQLEALISRSEFIKMKRWSHGDDRNLWTYFADITNRRFIILKRWRFRCDQFWSTWRVGSTDDDAQIDTLVSRQKTAHVISIRY